MWSKLRGYLARLSLVLAVCRCVTNNIREERVEAEDVGAAVRLLGYFKAHARRVYAELRSPDPLEVLGADLKELIEDAGGRLEATATELYHMLEEAGCEVLPARPKELSQNVRALADRSSALRAEYGHRGKERVIRLELLENSVGSVGKDPAPADATDATDARFTDQDGSDADPADATDASSGDRPYPEERRSRFTI